MSTSHGTHAFKNWIMMIKTTGHSVTPFLLNILLWGSVLASHSSFPPRHWSGRGCGAGGGSLLAIYRMLVVDTMVQHRAVIPMKMEAGPSEHSDLYQIPAALGHLNGLGHWFSMETMAAAVCVVIIRGWGLKSQVRLCCTGQSLPAEVPLPAWPFAVLAGRQGST